MVVVADVITPFFAAIIATRQTIGTSSPGDVILILLVDLRKIRFGEIVDVAAFDLVDGRVEWSRYLKGVVGPH